MSDPFHGPVVVRCVCSGCNGGWMSVLESEVKPYMGPMLHGVALTLNKPQQQALSTWAIKTAMVLEGTRNTRKHFYTSDECKSFRLKSTIPARSLIWIGMFSVAGGLHTDGMDLWLTVNEVAKAANGCITTLVIGKLVVQVLTAHFPAHYDKENVRIQCIDGPWNDALIQIWPLNSSIDWPPSLRFTEKGFQPIGALRGRWRYGTRRKS